MNAFGQPIIDDPSQAADAPGTNANDTNGAGTPQNVIDLNDPRLTSEILEANLEADAYAFPPPPPDAKYRAKLKLVQQENSNKEKMDYLPAVWGQKEQAVLVASIEASIIDPTGKYDGIKVYDRNVSTFLGRDGGTKVSTILARLKQPSGDPWVPLNARWTQAQWMQTLVKALAGEPEIGLETIWEWSCQKCGEEAKARKERYPRSVTGMHKFPQLKGQYQPEMKCSANAAHGYSRARATIGRFLHLSELK
jgi:hypothetical protein